MTTLYVNQALDKQSQTENTSTEKCTQTEKKHGRSKGHSESEIHVKTNTKVPKSRKKIACKNNAIQFISNTGL